MQASLESVWQLATDADEVHALLCASDGYAADAHQIPAPVRNRTSSRDLVLAGAVHLLRQDGAAVAMFTLTWQPPHGMPLDGFPPADKPAYLRRLAVRPDWISDGSLLGAQCLRRANETARADGADVLRAETNPGLTAMVAMLTAFGFVRCGRSATQIQLQHDLS
jgi:hypothetical protein